MKIVVISITQYKEKDGIINAVSETGSLSFLARGILDPKNKNSAINNNLVIADVELSEGKSKYPTLKNCTILATPIQAKTDLEHMASIMLIAEATKSLIQDEEKGLIYQSLIDALESLKTNEEPWMTLLVYFARIFKATGYEFEVNQCVFCGSKKDIITFSFADGGFVCSNCVEPNTEKDLSNEEMLLLRSAFNARDFSPSKYCTKENALRVLDKFFIFISDSYGITLKNAALIK